MLALGLLPMVYHLSMLDFLIVVYYGNLSEASGVGALFVGILGGMRGSIWNYFAVIVITLFVLCAVHVIIALLLMILPRKKALDVGLVGGIIAGFVFLALCYQLMRFTMDLNQGVGIFSDIPGLSGRAEVNLMTFIFWVAAYSLIFMLLLIDKKRSKKQAISKKKRGKKSKKVIEKEVGLPVDLPEVVKTDAQISVVQDKKQDKPKSVNKQLDDLVIQQEEKGDADISSDEISSQINEILAVLAEPEEEEETMSEMQEKPTSKRLNEGEDAQQQLEQLYQKLGQAYYESKYALPPPEVVTILDEIKYIKGEHVTIQKTKETNQEINKEIERFCPICALKLEEEARFCDQCGIPLR